MTLRTDTTGGIDYSPGRAKGFPKTEIVLEGSRIVRRMSDRWDVHSDDEAETGLAIYNQLPASLKVGFDYGDGFTIRRVALEREVDKRTKWAVLISGDDQVTDREKEDQNKPPDQRRPDWSWDFETLEIAMTQDVDGNPIQTTAGDPIEVTTPVVIPVLTVEKQEATFDPNEILDYVNHTNDAEFWGAPAGSVLCAGIRERQGDTFNGVEYRAVSRVFKFLIPDIPGVINGWKLLLVNHGPNYIVSGEKTAIKDSTGSKITSNITAAGTGLIDPGDDPYILTFTQFKEADFSLLGIDWPLT